MTFAVVKRRRILAVSVIAAALLVGAAPTSATSTATHDAGARGTWLVRQQPAGPVLVWRSPRPLPVTDARPEFRLGDRPIGYPNLGADGRTLRLPVAPTTLGPTSSPEAWLGARRLDARTASPQASSYRTDPRLTRAETPDTDPAAPGPYAVEEFDYAAADLVLPRLQSPVEVLGHAVLPVGVTDAPLVVFMHGRHQSCYGPGDQGGWPCAPGSQPVPSYLGYSYLQQMLAGQGYATVSVSANGVTAQDGDTNDGGAHARAVLVRHHLRLLADWLASGDDRWNHRLDMNQVILIGHSRGGEGMDQAAIDSSAADPFHIVGQVLIAPTDFAYQSAPYLPTEVLMGYCDGDVSDMQGERYVDAPHTLAPDDPTLRSSVLLMGANHNYFNTEWTPGLSAAPTWDDWNMRRDPVCGDKVSSTRLTAAEQRRAAMTFVAAGVHAFLGDDVAGALPYLDAAAPIALPDAGPAVALTHAVGGHRTTWRLGAGATATGAAEPCRTGYPDGPDPVPGPVPLCGLRRYVRQVHWTPTATFPASVHAAYAVAGLARDASLSWTEPAVSGGVTLAEPLDLTGPGDTLDLRVIADPRRPAASFRVVLGAAGQTWAGPVQSLTVLPGSSMLAALWAQTVRIEPTAYAGHLDLAHVDTVSLETVSAPGRVWLLDVSRRSPGLLPVPARALPRIHVGSTAQAEGDGTTGTARVPFHVTGAVTAPATFAVAVEQRTWGETTAPVFARVTVEPGQTDGTIAVPYEADRLQDLRRQVERVHAVARRGVVLGGFLGTAAVIDDDPMPTVTWRPVRRHVTYGHDIVFKLHLSKPVDYYVVNRLQAVRIAGYRPLRTSDVPKSWLGLQVGAAPPDVPLSRVWREGFVDLPPGTTTVRLHVPTLRHPLHEWRKALAVVFSAHRLTPRLRTYAVVRLP